MSSEHRIMCRIAGIPAEPPLLWDKFERKSLIPALDHVHNQSCWGWNNIILDNGIKDIVKRLYDKFGYGFTCASYIINRLNILSCKPDLAFLSEITYLIKKPTSGQLYVFINDYVLLYSDNWKNYNLTMDIARNVISKRNVTSSLFMKLHTKFSYPYHDQYQEYWFIFADEILSYIDLTPEVVDSITEDNNKTYSSLIKRISTGNVPLFCGNLGIIKKYYYYAPSRIVIRDSFLYYKWLFMKFLVSCECYEINIIKDIFRLVCSLKT